MFRINRQCGLFVISAAIYAAFSSPLMAKDIIHDAEYSVIEAQNREAWQADNKQVDQKLKDFRNKNGGKAPNIVYILLDDVGFGEIGMPDMAVTRGYKTPNMDKLANAGMSLQRMYTEPSCTPTRVAMMTGRLPGRTGLNEAKTTLSGEGLAAEEVTLAEVLKEAGYQTSHIGKWHMGDIEQAWAQNQGFDHAEFPIHQQAQLALMHAEAEQSDITRSIGTDGSYPKTFTLDNTFSGVGGDMLTGVEARNGKLYEVGIKAGEKWSQKKYHEMNVRYQKSALEQIGKMAKNDKPFYLNYWPLYPVTFARNDSGEFKTLNGGSFTEAIVQVDDWIGEIMEELKTQGVADNTIVVVMGDNGTMVQYMGLSGASDRVYRGGKGQHLEGGVRVNAFVSWPGMIEAGSMAEDIMHVSDFYTSFARLAGATDKIPRDRVIDGVDQTGVLLLGETHGRRDYIFNYEQSMLKSVVKNKFKMHLPGAGKNPIIDAGFYDLYRDPREERPIDSIKLGTWAAGSFGAMIKRHMGLKQKYPDRKPTYGPVYGGVENIRPETQRLVDAFNAGKKK
ncbi:MAG: sulfatase-like hydrolase/transferase [Halopseudomonas aestusnigri]